MRRVIAAINMTVDGYCDHTAGVADAELHRHYSDLIENAGVILYGRKTYELMQFWQSLLKNPSGEQSMDDFALAIDRIPKLVFSGTLKETGWESARLADQAPGEAIRELKGQHGKDILVGSRSLIIQLLNEHLVDEFQLCIHPVIEGKGLPLFDQIKGRMFLKLDRTKTLGSGATVFYYRPVQEAIK